MKRRIITMMMFLTLVFGTSWAADILTNGDGLGFSGNNYTLGGTSSNGVAREIWCDNAKAGFNFSQSVELPNGVYTLSMQAMYRASLESGTATNCVLYAETTGKVYNAPIANFGDYTAGESLNGVAEAMVNSADNYANSIPYFIVTDGRVNIGARSVGALTRCTNGYWFIWSSSSLRLGDVTDASVLEAALAEVKEEAKAILDNAEDSQAKTDLQAAYDNAEATSAGVVALKEAVRAYLPATASLESPVDVSSLMINPQYEETAFVVATGNDINMQPAGWLCTNAVTSGYNHFNVVGAGETYDGNSNAAYDATGKTLYMRYAWSGAPVMNAKQTVSLPAGNYRISVPARKNGSDIAVTVKYTFAGKTETLDVTSGWEEYGKNFTVDETNRDITVELGFSRGDVNVATQQAYFGGVTLTAYGDPVAAGRRNLQAEIDVLKAYADVTPSGLWTADGTYGKAVAAAEALVTTATEASVLEGMITILQKYSAEAEQLKPSYLALQALLDKCRIYAGEEYSMVETETIRETLTDAINSAEADANAAQTVSEIDGATTSLEQARRDYVANAEPIEGHVFDMTFRVATADCSSTSGWTVATTGSNKGQHWSGDGTNVYLEPCSWGAASWTASIKQTLTGLPNGLYRVTAAGRASENAVLTLVAGDVLQTFESLGDNGGTIATDGTEWESVEAGLAADKAFAKNNAGYGWTYESVEVLVQDGTLTFGCESTGSAQYQWASFDDVTLEKLRPLNLTESSSTIEVWKVKAETLAAEKPLGTAEKEALEKAVASAEALSDDNTIFDLNRVVAELQEAIAAVPSWRTAYESAKTPLVEAMERFERDYNDGGNGALRPMSTEAWNALLEAVKVASAAKDVTDSYDGFAAAAETFNAAMDAAEPSIKVYAGYDLMMSALNRLGDASLSEALKAVDTDETHATDASLRAAVLTMDEAFTAYRNTQDGEFSVSGLLGENLDFETVGDAVVGTYGAYTTVYDFPGWTNVFVANPTADNMEYMHKEQSKDVSADVTTEHSIYMRAKWDTGITRMQILKDTYLPSGEYTLSFYAKRTESSAITEDLCYYEIDGERTVMTLGSEWSRQTIDISLSEPKSFSLSFGFVRNTGNTDANVYADDIALTCHSQSAFVRALAAAQEQASSSRAAQAAYDEYKDAVEAELTTEERAEAVAVLNNSVMMAQNGEYATSLIKNVDFTGGVDSHAVKGSGGQVNTPKEWDFAYDFEGWNDTFVKTEEDGNGVFNLWAGTIRQGELMQEVTALPNGVYRLTADLTTDVNTMDGSSWVALYGYPTGDYDGIGRADNVTCGDPAEFANYEVLFRVSRHAATVGVRSDARYYQLKNIRLEYVEDNDGNAVKVENARLLQKAYVDRNNPVVDLTAFDKANGVQVYKNLKNGVIKAASEDQVLNTVNVVVDGVCKNYELTEGEPYAMSEGFTAEKATYSREMTAEWGTLMLPYALASDENIQYYKLTGIRTADDVDYMSFTVVDEVPANTPCVFRRLNDNTPVVFAAENAEIAPMSDATVSEETGLADWSVVGYYEKTVITDTDELAATYYISGDKFMNATKSLTISPFRATFVNAMANEVNLFMIDFNDGGVTGVKNASAGAALAVFGERGALRLVAGQEVVRYAVYTMAGVLAAQGALNAGEECSCELPAGIYIVNGLKVQVK